MATTKGNGNRPANGKAAPGTKGQSSAFFLKALGGLAKKPGRKMTWNGGNRNQPKP